MNAYPEENYLKALFLLADAKGETTVNALSKQLGITMPSVNSMIKKLAEKKLVNYESYKPLRLTEKGKKQAALIIRKHRLTEMFLVNKMGFGWEEVHEIAEQIEHIQSPKLFDKMDEMLGHPRTDPHGSPIPDSNGKMEWTQYNPLSECEAGTTVKLVAVTHSTDEFLRYLNSRKLKLGLQVTIISIEPFDRSMVVSYGKQQETLSGFVCDRLLTEKVK